MQRLVNMQSRDASTAYNADGARLASAACAGCGSSATLRKQCGSEQQGAASRTWPRAHLTAIISGIEEAAIVHREDVALTLWRRPSCGRNLQARRYVCSQLWKACLQAV